MKVVYAQFLLFIIIAVVVVIIIIIIIIIIIWRLEIEIELTFKVIWSTYRSSMTREIIPFLYHPKLDRTPQVIGCGLG